MQTSTNLQVLERSSYKQHRGNVFAMLQADGRFLFGRVIATDAVIGPMSNVILVYIYRVRAATKDMPERSNLRPNQLLLPPILTNRGGWTEGLFETIAHLPLDGDDVLERHCFRRWNGDYFDESSHPLPGPVEPVGDYGLHSFRTIDDEISDALGITRVTQPDSDPT